MFMAMCASEPACLGSSGASAAAPCRCRVHKHGAFEMVDFKQVILVHRRQGRQNIWNASFLRKVARAWSMAQSAGEISLRCALWSLGAGAIAGCRCGVPATCLCPVRFGARVLVLMQGAAAGLLPN